MDKRTGATTTEIHRCGNSSTVAQAREEGRDRKKQKQNGE